MKRTKNQQLQNLCTQMGRYIIAQKRGELAKEAGEAYLVLAMMSGRLDELADYLEKLVEVKNENDE